MGSEVKELAQSKSANFNIPFQLRMNLHTKIIRMLQAVKREDSPLLPC